MVAVAEYSSIERNSMSLEHIHPDNHLLSLEPLTLASLYLSLCTARVETVDWQVMDSVPP